MRHPSLLAETFEQMLRDQEPNFLRLYLNPHVAQACFCLDRYVRTTWTAPPASIQRRRHAAGEDFQSFLANGLEEALSGAIKLARYSQQTIGRRPAGLLFDPADRLRGFVSAELAEGGRVEFLPGLRVFGKDRLCREPGTLGLEGAAEDGLDEVGAAVVSPLVLVAGADDLLNKHAETIRLLGRRHATLVITCVDRESLATLRRGSGGILNEIVPDIVVFDESFADRAVPFGAFTARTSLFACWNRPGKSTFHSTTFQPNTISTLHFMRCLAREDPDFHGRYRDDFEVVLTDLSRRGDWFRRYYNPSLYRLIRAAGFNTADVRAAGSSVVVDGRSIFDTVGGVACSIRGHNPATYADEMKTLASVPPRGTGGEAAQSADANLAVRAELGRRLRDLTGLGLFLPAVSGATAVENALKVALVAQFPRRHILALKAGFGGKTLLSLTGTANPSYKERVDPLYADVHYVDPFAPDAPAQIDALLERHSFAVVQLELIQSVGGVRRVPESVVRHLDEGRSRRGYLLLVDEVQTGMYRTGPFHQSWTFDLTPDLLLLGKGTSDMMFPFALTLYSDAVQDMLERQGSDLADSIKERYNYEQGYRTVVNVLRRGEDLAVSRQVDDAAALFTKLLNAGLASGKIVRDVRVFGLLIGIELDARRWPQRWLRKRLAALYLLSMLRHDQFPVLAGFCQYEPNVLKITPPLNASPDEIRRACATIVDVLSRPLHKVLAAGLGGLIKSSSVGKKHHEHGNDPALELAAR
jgi:acetylornithine/succinyldiaminopimelate/putrescine aminotransferase